MRKMKIVAIVGLIITLIITVIALPQQQPTATITVQCKDNKLGVDKAAIVQLKQGHTIAWRFDANLNKCVQNLASVRITFSDSSPLQAPTPQPRDWPAIIVNITPGQAAAVGPFAVRADAALGGYLSKIEFFGQRDAQGSPSTSIEQAIVIQGAPPFIHKVTIEISGRAQSGNLFIKVDDRDPIQTAIKDGQGIKEIRDAAVTALNNQQAGTAQAIDDNRILVNADKEIRIGENADQLNFLAFEEGKSVPARGLSFKVAIVSAEIVLAPPHDANGILLAAAQRWIIAEARWTQDGAIVGDPIKELTGKEVASLEVGFRSRFGTVKIDDQEIKLSPPSGANDILIVAKDKWVIQDAWWTKDGKKQDEKQIASLSSQRFEFIHTAVATVKVSIRVGAAEIVLAPPQDANGILLAAAQRWIIAEARWTQDGAIVGDPIKELSGKEVTSLSVGFGSRFGTVKIDDQEIKLSPPSGANDILIVTKDEWVIQDAWWTKDGTKQSKIESLINQRFKFIHVAVAIVKVSIRVWAAIVPIRIVRWESRFPSGDRENRVINFVQVVPQLGKCGILNNVDIINKTSESANDFEVVVEGTYAHVERIGPQPEILYYPALFEQVSQGNQTIFRWRWTRGVPPGGFVHLGLWVWSPDCNIRIKSMTLTRDGKVIGKVPASGLGITPQGKIIIINDLSESIETRDVQMAQPNVPLPLPTLNAQELPKQLQQQGVNLKPVPVGGVINPGQNLSFPMLSITVSPSSAETSSTADIRLENIGMTDITIKSVTVTRPNGSVDTVSAFTNLKLQPGEAKTERYSNTGLAGTYIVKATFDSTEVTERFERSIPPSPPSFRVSTSVDRPSPCQGETVTITTTVRNVGNGSGTADLELRIDGSLQRSWSLSLAPGERTTVDYRTSFSSGRHTIEARVFWRGSLHDSDSTTIEARSGIFFNVGPLDAPSRVKPNESFTVSAPIRNSGCSLGSQTIRLLVDGSQRDSTRVSLGAGESTKVSFRLSFSSRGNYRVTVASDNDSSSTTIQVDGVIPTLTEWGLIALAVLLAGSLAWMIRRRVAIRPAGA